MKRFLAKTALFLAGYLILVQAGKLLNREKFWGNAYFVLKSGVYQKQNAQKKYNAVFVGSSHFYWQVNPALFDSLVNASLPETHLSTFNFGSPSAFPPETYRFAEDLVQPGSGIRYLFLELSKTNNYNSNVFSPRGNYWLTPGETFFAVRETRASRKEKRLSQMGFLLAGSLQNFLTLRELTYEEELPSAYAGRAQDGFVSLDDTGGVSLADARRRAAFLKDTSAVHTREKLVLGNFLHPDRSYVNRVHLGYMLKLIRYYEQAGVYVVFVLSPLVTDSEEMTLFLNLPEEHRLELSDPRKYPGFYRAANCFDVGHLNAKGSRLFTSEMARNFISMLQKYQGSSH